MKIEIQAELERIRLCNDGILRPTDVVETAKDPDNILHDQFTWDDKEAAHQHRLQQARQLIRICVETVPSISAPVRAYLNPAPKKGDEGYRTYNDVMSSDVMRAQMLTQAKNDMKLFEAKYRQLEELADVIQAMRAVA